MNLSRNYSYVKGGSDFHNLKLGFATSWLDPDGEFYPIARSGGSTHSWTSHSDWALQHGYNMDELFEEGWMRVLYIGDTIYASNNFDVPLNHIQVSNLVDYAIMSRKFNEVVYEGSSGDRSIWREE